MMKIKNLKFYIFALVGLILTIALWQHPDLLGATAGATLSVTPFVSLEKEQGCNMAGIATVAYVININDIQAFPSMNPPTSPEDLVLYIGDFILKPNKYFYTLYSTKEMGELIAEINGPTDGKFYRNKATLFYPRTTPKALGMSTLLKDADVIVILKEFGGGGQLRVLGNIDIPASIAGTENSGKAYGDEKGITFAIEAAECTHPKVYSGQIVTETTVIYSPIRLSVDATSIDAAVDKRFVVGANTSAIILSSIDNMLPGDVIRIEFDSNSTGSLAFNGAFSSTALIDADGEWFEVTKIRANSYVISSGNFS